MRKTIISKIKNKLLKSRLSPIRVFLFHHVSDEYDNTQMKRGDWTQIEDFKKNIKYLKSKYKFISLSQAHHKLCRDVIRTKRYAVLTSDDGYSSLLNILPWLIKQDIPVTLFINGKYLDEVSFREKPSEQYLSYKSIFSYSSKYIEIASHGWTHQDMTMLTEPEISKMIKFNQDLLTPHLRYINFFAFPYGKYNPEIISIVHKFNLIPVFIDGSMNYNDNNAIHRELLDGKKYSNYSGTPAIGNNP